MSSARRTIDPGQGRLAAALLIVAMAARSRRGFEGLEWYHILLELPAYALAVRTLLEGHRIRGQPFLMVYDCGG